MAGAIAPRGYHQIEPLLEPPLQPPLALEVEMLSPTLTDADSSPKPEPLSSSIKVAIEAYGKTLAASLVEIPDPINRALFLIRLYQALTKTPEMQSTLVRQREFICSPIPMGLRDYTLVTNEALPFANRYLIKFCAEGDDPNFLTGMIKWILLQTLLLVRQIEILALTPQQVNPSVVHRQLIETTNFISSLPEDFDSPIRETEDVNLVAIKELLFTALKTLLFQTAPLPDSFNLDGPKETLLTAMKTFLITDEALIRLQAKNKEPYPIKTLPSIFTLGVERPPKETDSNQLIKARKQLQNEKVPMLFRQMALSCFIHYSSGPLFNTDIPKDLRHTLDCNIGRILYPNHPDKTSLILNTIGFACRKDGDRYRHLCMNGAILAIYETIRSCVLEATSSLDDPFDAPTTIDVEKAVAFYHLNSFNQLLREVRNLRSVLFEDQAISQAEQTLDDGMQVFIDASIAILTTSLKGEMEPYMKDWDALTGLNLKTYSNDSVRTADYLIQFHQFFLLRRLIILCSELQSNDPDQFIFKMITHLRPKDRLHLLEKLCTPPDSPYKNTQDLWLVALEGSEELNKQARTFLASHADTIKKEATNLLEALKDANKATVSHPKDHTPLARIPPTVVASSGNL